MAKKRLNWITISLVVFFSLFGSVTAFAEDNEEKINNVTVPETNDVSPYIEYEYNDGYINMVLKNYEIGQDDTGIIFAIWSEEKGQDDLIYGHAYQQENSCYEYTWSIEDHNDEKGIYNVLVYINRNDGTTADLLNEQYVIPEEEEIKSEENSNFIEKMGATSYAEVENEKVLPEINLKLDSTEQFCVVSVSNYVMPQNAECLLAAVWSEENGQDDLTWSSFTPNNATFEYVCNIAEHGSKGKYQVHVYLRNKDQSMQMLGERTFEIAGNTCDSVLIENYDKQKGTCQININGVESPSGIKNVQVAVWSRLDQSDLCWYTANKKSEGFYQVNFSLANHNYNLGQYQIHVYITNNNNICENKSQTTLQFQTEHSEVVVSEKQSSIYQARIDDVIVPGGNDAILFAVWSESNGQDDLAWYEISYNSNDHMGECIINLEDYKSFGRYQVHAYARRRTGQMVFLSGTTFDVPQPQVKNVEIEQNQINGSFKIIISGVDCQAGIDTIMVPVWCQSDQSDLVWYTAKKATDGSYVVDADISQHQYHIGTYQVHVYVNALNGISSNVYMTTMDFSYSVGTITMKNDTKETNYSLTVEGVVVPAKEKNVLVAVWSENGGQDDLAWYTASAIGNGSYVANIAISNHKTLGKYYVHIYAETKSGQMIFLGEYKNLSISGQAKAAINIISRDENKGEFTVEVQISDSPSGVNKVQVPVWCTSDQSDLVWYTASKQSETTYTVTVNVGNHNCNLGIYQINAYTVMGNGIFVGSGSTAYEFNPSNYLGIKNDVGWGSRRLILKNVDQSITRVQFPVWSNTNGQDDLIWYEATKNSNGDWEAIISSKNHKNPGTFSAHAYVDGRYVRAISFEFPADEFGKNGWYYENGYKLYYQDDKLVTDVSGIIGPQSEYMAKVNRVTCTVTIYAKDGNNGFIIPVKVFACSVGLPGTETPLGTYHTLAKYRWHELMGPSYGQYCTRIVGGILFHSVAGSNMTSYNLSAAEYNKLGSPASHGCVRLNVRDAKWIYDNCRLGMTVVIYDSSDPGPFGKPATIKIPANQNWDPTDPNV